MMYLAANSPQDVLASGNTTAILALIIVVLVGVIVYMNKQNNTKNEKIEDTLNSRIQDAKEARDSIVAPLELIGRQNDLILKNLNKDN